MTDIVSGARPPRDLAARLFRALYDNFDLRAAGDLHVAVPKGTVWYAARSLGELALQIVTGPPPFPPPRPGDRPAELPGRAAQVIRLPTRDSATRLTRVLREYPSWSVFLDRRYCVWRAAEDDLDSVLYAEDPDLDTVISYITSHS